MFRNYELDDVIFTAMIQSTQYINKHVQLRNFMFVVHISPTLVLNQL